MSVRSPDGCQVKAILFVVFLVEDNYFYIDHHQRVKIGISSLD